MQKQYNLKGVNTVSLDSTISALMRNNVFEKLYEYKKLVAVKKE